MRHHRFVHEYGFTVEPAGDGFTFRDPDGIVVPEVPPRGASAETPRPTVAPHAQIPPSYQRADYAWIVDGLAWADAHPSPRGP